MQIDFEAFDTYISEHSRALSEINPQSIESLVEKFVDCWKRDGILWIAGNGGSASSASHATCDLSKGLWSVGMSARTISLVESVSQLTAWSNDTHYEIALTNVAKNFVRQKDHVLLISGSGNSKNILDLAAWCKETEIDFSYLVGMDGGKLKSMHDTGILVPSPDMQVIENIHLMLIHWFFKAASNKV